jgi:hypothetical protein
MLPENDDNRTRIMHHQMPEPDIWSISSQMGSSGNLEITVSQSADFDAIKGRSTLAKIVHTPFAALNIALTLAVATSRLMPAPNSTGPSPTRHST